MGDATAARFWSGLDCGLANAVLSCNETVFVDVRADGWAYMVLGLPSMNATWQVSLTASPNASRV